MSGGDKINYIIENATIVTMNEDRDILENYSIVVEGKKIFDISDCESIQEKYDYSEYRIISGEGNIIFPGLINNHTHLFQTLMKGLGDDMALDRWFTEMTAPSAVHLSQEEVYHAALLGSLESIESGTTTIMDYMYAHPREGLSDSIIKAFQRTGIRGILARGTHNTGEEFGNSPGIIQKKETIVSDCKRLLSKYHKDYNNRIKIWLAPAAIWTNTEQLLKELWELAQKFNTGMTAHVSETPFDRECSEQLHGENDINALKKYGIYGGNLLLVHCVHLSETELDWMADEDIKISYNPVSNMYLASGIAPITRAKNKGICVGLATDGAASNNTQNMIECLKSGALLQKVGERDPTAITAEQILSMATIEGAKTLGLENEIGSIEAGKKADLFIYNPDRSFNSLPTFSPVSTLVYAGDQRCVESVMIAGELIYHNCDFNGLDTKSIKERVQQTALSLAKKAGNI